MCYCAASVQAQYVLPESCAYPFLNREQNRLIMPTDSSAFNRLFETMAKMTAYGTGYLHILHLGDSHIQADVFSGELRKQFLKFVPGSQAGRGIVFPYKVAHTNGPNDYKVTYNGLWVWGRNIQRNGTMSLGLSGIAVSTNQPSATITIDLSDKKQEHQKFSSVRLYYKPDSCSYEPFCVANAALVSRKNNPLIGVCDFRFAGDADSLQVYFKQTDSLQSEFQLDAIRLRSDEEGITYSSVGINGADLTAWLRCNRLERQLKDEHYDLIVVSLGTNDSYMKFFDTTAFAQNFNELIDIIQRACPRAAVLLTTPADNYRKRKYSNQNPVIAGEVMRSLAKQRNAAVWDLFTVMGGQHSMLDWQKNGLSAGDKIHFSNAGYRLQGDLLFEAIVKSFDDYITFRNRKAQKK